MVQKRAEKCRTPCQQETIILSVSIEKNRLHAQIDEIGNRFPGRLRGPELQFSQSIKASPLLQDFKPFDRRGEELWKKGGLLYSIDPIDNQG